MAILQNKPNDINAAVHALTPMIHKLAHKFCRNHRSNDFDDLVQHGYEGFMQAWNRYDGSKGCAFSSYAYQWIFAAMNDDRRKTYKLYNNTAGLPVEEQNLGTYEMPIEDYVDSQRISERMDSSTRAIHTARQEGYTYREISEALTKLGKPCTLHQVRRQHLAALEA